ncbi:MAG TPA: hypothetical protein DCW74_09730 [Alteromonas australica]|uniref:Uncharacterized protein n=1 Tax=Alteromonas australica TaxID=589873 RepID=A0A350P3Y1_9ALTE|nr:hypothetical protein [Alteromonas australica]|tara:strand:+ start:9833 stop:10255 length:423 start_codon:yes stop_codon:yes gene_type:complete
MAYGEGADPRTATLKTGTTVSGPGLLLTNDSTNNTLDLTAANEIAIGVSAGDSTRDVDGTLQTAAGATVSYYPLGGVLMVQSEASQTYTTGLLVYAQASGLCGTTSSSRKLIGVYVGTGETTSGSAGDMIPVMTAGAATA